jgi:hypothetical protein
MTETLNILAALATSAVLLRSMTGSIDLVAKAIWDWKSIMISVWSVGVSKVLPGVAFAVGMSILRVWSLGLLMVSVQVLGQIKQKNFTVIGESAHIDCGHLIYLRPIAGAECLAIQCDSATHDLHPSFATGGQGM